MKLKIAQSHPSRVCSTTRTTSGAKVRLSRDGSGVYHPKIDVTTLQLYTINLPPRCIQYVLDTPAFHRPRQPHARAANSNQNCHPHCRRREAGSTEAEHHIVVESIAVEPIATSFVTASIDFVFLLRYVASKLITS